MPAKQRPTVLFALSCLSCPSLLKPRIDERNNVAARDEVKPDRQREQHARLGGRGQSNKAIARRIKHAIWRPVSYKPEGDQKNNRHRKIRCVYGDGRELSQNRNRALQALRTKEDPCEANEMKRDENSQYSRPPRGVRCGHKSLSETRLSSHCSEAKSVQQSPRDERPRRPVPEPAHEHRQDERAI